MRKILAWLFFVAWCSQSGLTAQEERVFAAGDEVQVIAGKQAKDFLIAPDGTLQLPGRSFVAAGKSRRQLEREISAWANMPVSVSLKRAVEQVQVAQRGAGLVLIVGHQESVKPGLYPAGPLKEVLARAGGTTSKAKPWAYVWRGTQKHRVEDALKSDFLLVDGDVVEVQKKNSWEVEERISPWARIFRDIATPAAIVFAAIRIAK